MEEPYENKIMKFFEYAHLPEKLQAVSKPFCDLAKHIDRTVPGGPEKSVALRKLLESKDAGVRASL
jgi:hypothetical protein